MTIDNRQYPCAKQTVTAVLKCPDGTEFTSTNWCHNDIRECPRAANHMESGQGYDLCRKICNQEGHAEENVCRLAKEHAKGATLYLTGHTYICNNCLKALKVYGVTNAYIRGEDGSWHLRSI